MPESLIILIFRVCSDCYTLRLTNMRTPLRLPPIMILFDEMVKRLLRLLNEVHRVPLRRVGIAFSFSILLHAVIVWMPSIHLPLTKVKLPPLSIRLDALPEKVVASDAINQAEDKSERATRTKGTGIKSSSKTLAELPSSMKKMEKSDVMHSFPKHLHLVFSVFKGTGRTRIGDAEHKLDLQSDRYTLSSIKRTAKIPGLLGQEQLIQTSLGVIGERGMIPEIYKEKVITSDSRQEWKVNFDRVSQSIHFSHGAVAALPDGAQDALSYMYQLSQLSMNREIIPLTIANSTAVQEYHFEIGETADIETPAGKVHTVHLRKLHENGEPYMEIWLGLEYRLLPMKLRWKDGAGEDIEELVITDIRASDE